MPGQDGKARMCTLPLPSVPRRGRPSVKRSKELTQIIIAHATDIFLDIGYYGATMGGIAVSAGIPKKTLYNRFGDKEALLREVIAHRVQSWSDLASTRNHRLTNDLGQRLKFHTAAILCWATTPEVEAFGRLAASVTTDGGRARLDMLGHQRMTDLIERDVREFGPVCGIQARDPKRVAIAIMSLIKGWLDNRIPTGPMSDVEAENQAEFLIDLILHGRKVW